MARKAAISTESVSLPAPRVAPQPPHPATRSRLREMVQFMVEEEQQLEVSLAFLLFGFEAINNHSGFNNGRVIGSALTYRVLSEHLEKLRETVPNVEALAHGTLEALAEAACKPEPSMHVEDD